MSSVSVYFPIIKRVVVKAAAYTCSVVLTVIQLSSLCFNKAMKLNKPLG